MTDSYDRNQMLRDYRVWREQTWGGAVEQALGYTEADRLNDELALRRRARDFIDEYELRYEGRRVPTMTEAMFAVQHNADGRGPVRHDTVLGGTPRPTSEVAAELHHRRPDCYIAVSAGEPPSQWAGQPRWGGVVYGPSSVSQVGNPQMAAEVEDWSSRIYRTVG